MSRKRLGRPSVYVGAVKRHIQALIRKYGLTGARNRLNAKARTALAKQRSLTLVPKPLGISMPTLSGFAREAKITLHRGRPAA